MLTSSQIRIARHALRLSVARLSELSGISTSTIKRIEVDDGVPKSTKANLAALQATLETAGIEFIGSPDDAPGIRIHSQNPAEEDT